MINKRDIKKVSYIIITSDFFHYGHFNAIKFAKSISEYLICGILTTKNIIPERKESLTTLEERKEFVSNLKFVDRVITQSEIDPTENLKKIHKEFPRAEIILVHDPDLKKIFGLDYVKKIKGQVMPHPKHTRISIHKEVGIHGGASSKKENQQKFVHAWGGTTSIQSLECHTLRYVKFPNNLANHITGKILCEIRNKHHTVYFNEKDIKLWNKEGAYLLDRNKQKRIIKKNLNQIKRFFSFYEEHKNKDYSRKTNKELLSIYNKLMYLVMENGSFFPYSREEPTKIIKEKIFSFLEKEENKLEIFQLLTTPIKKNIFIEEILEKSSLLKKNFRKKEELWKHAKKHPWRFINTYSKEKICHFLLQEMSEINLNELEKEIKTKFSKNRKLRKKQKEYFEKVDSIYLKGLCIFLQKIAIIRLRNKYIWAGYELLFLELFQEIAKRIGLSIEDYLASYRIEDTKNFLELEKKLLLSEIEKRKHFFILEISNNSVNYCYTPKIVEKITNMFEGDSTLKGEAGNLGRVVGRALVVIEDNIESLMKIKKKGTTNDIYITTMTHPAMVSILHNVNGIVTDEGGVTSHASIISRELGIPCLVGTKDATRFFKTGEIIELDSYNGKVRKLTREEVEEYKSVHQIKKKTLPNKELKINRPIPNNSMPYTVNFKKINQENCLIGGKAKNLLQISNLHKVPEFFCLTRRLFDEILNEILKDNLVLKIDNTNEFKRILQNLREKIKNYKFKEELNNEILNQLHLLNCEFFAIRSSASCEDSSKRSFAGQFKTFLGVYKEDILDYIKECIASAFKENVLLYLANSEANITDFYMGVIVQKFLPAQKAGVFFSENPSDSLEKSFCIDANFGVGESVVSGETKPDRYLINNKGNITPFVSEKKKVHNYNKGNLIITEENKRVLNEDEIYQLVKLGKSLLEFYDIKIEYEWCFFEGSLFLLQVRPITQNLNKGLKC